MKILRYLLLQILACLIITSYSIGQSTLTVANGGKMKITSGTSVQQQNLNIGSGSQLVNRGDLTVSGVLVNYAGTPGLILKADENGYGSLMHSTPVVPATAEQYLTSERWHLVSPPVSIETIEPYLDIYLKKYHETNDTWEYLTQPLSIELEKTKGYSAWASDEYTGTTTVYLEGTLTAGDIVVQDISYTIGSPKIGWNLIGNPYPSTVDWNTSWNLTNMGGWAVIYENGTNKGWNPYLTGDLRSYNGKTDGLIAPQQGFWVRALDNNASVVIKQSARSHGDVPFYKDNYAGKSIQNIRLTVTANGYSDATTIIFHEEGTNDFDGLYELEKHWNIDEAPNIYSTGANGGYYSVNVLPEDWIENNDLPVIPVGFKIDPGTDCQILATGMETFNLQTPIFLEDLKEETFHDLRNNPIYTFTTEPDDDENRFLLHFSEMMSLEDELFSSILVYSYENAIYIHVPKNITGAADVFDLMGQQIAQFKIDQMLTRKVIDKSTGYYIVTIYMVDNMMTKKVYIKN